MRCWRWFQCVSGILSALLGSAAQADDAQCSSSSSATSSEAGGFESGGLGWRENATHATTACNMPVLDAGAGGLTLSALVQRLAAATTPLLIRGLLDHQNWRAQAGALGNRSALLEDFSGEQMQLSVATLLSNGPESKELDGRKLSFMREAWGAVDGSVLGDGVERQVREGEPRPRVGLGSWVAALRQGTAPPDAYVFQNISGGPVAQALAPLHALWRATSRAHFALQQRSSQSEGAPAAPSLMRLGVGGSGSGAPFHDHSVVALNVAFAGRKRWLVARPCRPFCRIPFFKSGAAVYHPEMLLNQGAPPPGFKGGAAAALLMLGAGGDTWDCTQHPGEVVYVPAMFLHATVNLDESVAAAVQCDDGADPRVGLSELNALIVHASGAASALSPCGTAWESPEAFRDVGADEALGMLERLPDNFRGDPGVFLNRPHASDGHAPVDVAVRFGSARVASALATHGARFLPRHLADAQQHGREALATFIAGSLKRS
jgi:hypothetical protein